MSELSRAVRARSDERGTPLPSATEAFGEDIERWLSYLAEPLPWLDEPATLRNRAAFADVSRAIDELLTERQERVVRSPKPAWLSDLVGFWNRSESTVITFNYDVLVEAAAMDVLDRVRYSWSSLYRVPVTPAASRIAAVHGDSGPAPFSLLKLHGSVTWYWSRSSADANDPIFDIGLRGGWSLEGVTSFYAEHLPSLVADKVPMVIPPTASKSRFYENALIRSQWHQAAKALECADELVIIGYSLPQSDLIVRALLATALNNKAVVSLVDQDLRLADRAVDVLGDRIRTDFLAEDEPVARFVELRCKRWGEGGTC